jgi:hypothetical protein
MPPVNSFDVFDTLIARRCVEPRRVLDELESRAALPGLAEIRLAADRALGSLGRPYDLRAIWQHTAQATGIDASTMERLLALEVALEHEQVLPIVENLTLVRDGDLLVSDTYLPADIVLSLLRKAGLARVVGLVVSNAGKYTGKVWPEILARQPIREHFGDNPHSDGRTPSEAGIRAIIYTGAQLTPVERLLSQAGWEPLARLTREVRLANPFSTAQAQQRHLWNLSCQLNFPLLFFTSLWLERSALRAGASELFFVSRDGLQWRSLHERLFPHRRSTYLYGSRLCSLKPSENYLAYFRSVWQRGGLIVDLFSTGASWASLFARLGTPGRCRFIGWIDNHVYLAGGPAAQDWLEVEVIFQNSTLGLGVMNKNIEMLNYAPHGMVEDVLPLPGGGALPILSRTLEYDPTLPQAAHAAFASCVRALDHYPDLSRCRSEAPTDMIRTLVSLISAEPGLPTIYAGHDAADHDYHQRLFC